MSLTRVEEKTGEDILRIGHIVSLSRTEKLMEMRKKFATPPFIHVAF